MHWIIGVEKIHFIHNFIIFWSQDLSFQAKIKKFIDNVTNILAEPKVSNVDLFSTMILWNSIGSPPSYSKLSTCHVKNIRRLFGLTNGALFSLMSLNQLSPCSVFTWKKLFPTSKCHWVFRILYLFTNCYVVKVLENWLLSENSIVSLFPTWVSGYPHSTWANIKRVCSIKSRLKSQLLWSFLVL